MPRLPLTHPHRSLWKCPSFSLHCHLEADTQPSLSTSCIWYNVTHTGTCKWHLNHIFSTTPSCTVFYLSWSVVCKRHKCLDLSQALRSFSVTDYCIIYHLYTSLKSTLQFKSRQYQTVTTGLFKGSLHSAHIHQKTQIHVDNSSPNHSLYFNTPLHLHSE